MHLIPVISIELAKCVISVDKNINSPVFRWMFSVM